MKTNASVLNPDLPRNPGADWCQGNDSSVPAHSEELLEARHWDWSKTQ